MVIIEFYRKIWQNSYVEHKRRYSVKNNKTNNTQSDEKKVADCKREEELNYDINTVISRQYRQQRFYKEGIYTIRDLLDYDECRLYSNIFSAQDKLISRIHEMGFKFKFEEKRREDTELIGRIKRGEDYSVEEAKNIYITNIPGVSFRLAYRLAREGIMNVGDVCQNSEETLSNIHAIGATALKKIKDGVHVLNLKLKDERSEDEILSERLEEKIGELKFAYTELQNRKNTYKLKVKKLEQEIKGIQCNNVKLNKQLKRVEDIINQNKEGLIEDNLLENFNAIFDKIIRELEKNNGMLTSKNRSIEKNKGIVVRVEKEQKTIKEQLRELGL